MTVRIKRFAPFLSLGGGILVILSLCWALVQGQFGLVAEIALAVGALALAGAVALNPGRAWQALTGRTARQGGNATLVTIAVIGILVLLNFLADRHFRRLDLTAEKQFTLSKQTVQILAGLKDPLTVTAFMTPNYASTQQVEDLLKEYSQHTNKLHVQIVDPEQKPAEARQYHVTTDGTVIFQSGNRQQSTLGADEKSFTGAILKVTQGQTKTVYFLTGHQERDPQDSGGANYQQIGTALQNDNYKVDMLNLAITQTIPSDAAALIIASPMITPTAKEYQAINDYVTRGGSLMVLADPQSHVNMNELLQRWGLKVRQDIIVDPTNALYGDVGTPLVSRYPYHDITKDLNGLSTFFPLASSIEEPQSPPTGVQVSPLVQSSAQSWGETDRTNNQVQYDAGKDTRGPLDLAVAATLDVPDQTDPNQTKTARLVLFGDADFVANDMLTTANGASGNPDLFLNSVDWLTSDESLISIRSTPPVDRTIMMTPGQVRVVMYTSMLFLPAVVVLAGVWVWWRRR